MSNIEQKFAKDIWTEIKEDPSITLVDVRTSEELQEIGMPDNSSFDAHYIHIPIAYGKDMEFNINFIQQLEEKVKDHDKAIMFICAAGVRSQNAAELAEKLGYKKIINITDGFIGKKQKLTGWKNSNLPWKKLEK